MGKTAFDPNNSKNIFWGSISFLAFKQIKDTFAPIAGFKNEIFWLILGLQSKFSEAMRRANKQY